MAQLEATPLEGEKVASMEHTSTTTMMPALAPTDVELRRQVLDELAWDGHVRPSESGVAVHDGAS